MANVIINLLEAEFPNEDVKEVFMGSVESDDSVFSFEFLDIDTPLDAVSFKPVGDGFMFLFITEDEDVKGELLVLSEEFPSVRLNYVTISPGGSESVNSMQIEGGELLSIQTIIGHGARLIGEMAKGGFAGIV